MLSNKFNKVRGHGNLYNKIIPRWSYFHRMIGTGLIVICVVLFTGCNFIEILHFW